jgi:uncharacterized membrane protein YphA (DoxX/SURF4 family)
VHVLEVDVLEPFVVAAGGLLLLAGVPKVRDPHPLVRALSSVGLRVPTGLARLLAVVEVVLGLLAVVAPVRTTAAGVALLYAGFTAFVAVALARGGVVESCGCLGRADTPPTLAHVATTATLAVAGALAVLAQPAPDLWWERGPTTALAVAGLAALLGFVAWVILAVLPLVTPAAVRSTGRA